MYLRTTQRRNTDGSIVRYIQLAHNHRVEGVTQAEVLVNLGREDRLDLRPVYHRIEPRIRAHVLLCWLALLLIRVAERRTAMTWRRIAIELGRIHAVTLTGTAGTVTQTSPLTEIQQAIVDACKVAPPPRVAHLHPT